MRLILSAWDFILALKLDRDAIYEEFINASSIWADVLHMLCNTLTDNQMNMTNNNGII